MTNIKVQDASNVARLEPQEDDEQLRELAVARTQVDRATEIYHLKVAGVLPWSRFEPPEVLHEAA